MTAAGDIADRFYQAFATRDDATMGALYGEDARFSDPVFPDLDAQQARAMWSMLLRSGSDLKIDYQILSATETTAKTQWTAHYHFSATGRPVTNVVVATMDVSEGKIRRHRDAFSFYRWSAQALGLPGLLIGWSPILRAKVRAQAAARLRAFMTRQA